VYALDLLPMDAIAGVTFQQGDFREQAALDALLAELGGRRVDLVLSDMAPNMSGVDVVDQARAADLEALALDFARQVLRPGGVLVMKVFQGAGFQQAAGGGPSRVRRGPHAQAQGVEAAQFRDVLGGQGLRPV
jgi:23S rRNA (uridine2552-2'-O)-methyltransferase